MKSMITNIIIISPLVIMNFVQIWEFIKILFRDNESFESAYPKRDIPFLTTC